MLFGVIGLVEAAGLPEAASVEVEVLPAVPGAAPTGAPLAMATPGSPSPIFSSVSGATSPPLSKAPAACVPTDPGFSQAPSAQGKVETCSSEPVFSPPAPADLAMAAAAVPNSAAASPVASPLPEVAVEEQTPVPVSARATPVSPDVSPVVRDPLPAAIAAGEMATVSPLDPAALGADADALAVTDIAPPALEGPETASGELTAVEGPESVVTPPGTTSSEPMTRSRPTPRVMAIAVPALAATPISSTAPTVAQETTDLNQLAPSLGMPQDEDPSAEAAPRDESGADDASAEAAPRDEPAIEDIFEEVFGRPRNNAPQQVVVPVIVNDQSQGQALVIVPGGNQVDVRVVARDLLAAMADRLRSDVQQELDSQVDPDGTLNFQSLRQVGLEVNFDTRRLELSVQIPPELRSTAVLDLQPGGVPAELSRALAPSHFSGYLNVRGGQDIRWSGDAGSGGRQPLRLNFDGAVNAHNWVLEGSLNFVENSVPSWRRGNVSLVHDDLQSAIRYRVGDLSMPIQGYQSSLPMVGLTVARNFALQPFTVTRPVSRFEFFLANPSTVEVFVNSQLVQTLRLDAGLQDIRDLPLNAGINGVQLVVTDDVGQVQRLDFAAGVAGGLLAPGIQQFAYSFGFPAESTSSGYVYDFSKPTLTLSHRTGLTDTLTVGGYLQGDLTQQLLGVEGIWATSVGNLGWNMALSRDPEAGVGMAAQLFYDLLTYGETSADRRSLRIAAEYRSRNFITLGQTEPSNPTSLDLSLAYSQRLFGDMQATLSGRYQLARETVSDGYTVALALSKPIAQGLSLSISGSYGLSTSGEREQRIFTGITASFPQQRQFVNASTTLDRNSVPTSRMTWNYSSPVTIGGISTALTTALNSSDVQLLSQTRYRGYRADLSFDHTLGLPRDDSGRRENISRFTWGTALVFAEGVFGWSRPIDNSFALVTRQGTARDQLVRLNPSLSGETARTDQWGAAVVPLSPYALTTLSVDAPNLPLGYDLGPPSYALFPTYRSGTLIRVGSEATVFLRGVLVDDQGEPLALQRGRVVSLSDPDWPELELFTNRAGRFALQGLKPGQYQIYLFGVPEAIASFTIPDTAMGVFDLETLATNQRTAP